MKLNVNGCFTSLIVALQDDSPAITLHYIASSLFLFAMQFTSIFSNEARNHPFQ